MFLSYQNPFGNTQLPYCLCPLLSGGQKVAFLVFIGVDKPIQYYYNELYKYIESRGLKPASEIFSLEAIYQPDEFKLSYGSFINEDNPEHWRTEIMIPVEE